MSGLSVATWEKRSEGNEDNGGRAIAILRKARSPQALERERKYVRMIGIPGTQHRGSQPVEGCQDNRYHAVARGKPEREKKVRKYVRNIGSRPSFRGDVQTRGKGSGRPKYVRSIASRREARLFPCLKAGDSYREESDEQQVYDRPSQLWVRGGARRSCCAVPWHDSRGRGRAEDE